MSEVVIKNINKWQSFLIILILAFGVVNCSDSPALKQLPEDAVILAFGDSLTAGNGVARINSYPAIIAPVVKYVNYAA